MSANIQSLKKAYRQLVIGYSNLGDAGKIKETISKDFPSISSSFKEEEKESIIKTILVNKKDGE